MFTLNNLMLAAEDVAHAAGGHPEGAGVFDLSNTLPGIVTLVVFVGALAVLYFKVWPKITQGLDDRQSKIREEIAAAERARAKANAALAEYEQNVAAARAQADAMIAKARADAKAVAEELRAKNEAELASMKERARADIESAKRAAIVELHDHAATLATSVAAKILRREISVEDQQQLVRESLDELAAQRSAETEHGMAGAAS